MNGSRLRLYVPPDEYSASSRPEMAPRDILPFDGYRGRVVFSGRIVPAVERARLIHENSVCPQCDRHDVEPLELDDAWVSTRGRLPVPGTATLVGFHCNDCGAEWPIYELTQRNA